MYPFDRRVSGVAEAHGSVFGRVEAAPWESVRLRTKKAPFAGNARAFSSKNREQSLQKSAVRRLFLPRI
jgi:hypothetical protein